MTDADILQVLHKFLNGRSRLIVSSSFDNAFSSGRYLTVQHDKHQGWVCIKERKGLIEVTYYRNGHPHSRSQAKIDLAHPDSLTQIVICIRNSFRKYGQKR